VTNVTNMPWTFAVVFVTIFAVILIFAVIWVRSQSPRDRHR
jgi:hypothetical protein